MFHIRINERYCMYLHGVFGFGNSPTTVDHNSLNRVLWGTVLGIIHAFYKDVITRSFSAMSRISFSWITIVSIFNRLLNINIIILIILVLLLIIIIDQFFFKLIYTIFPTCLKPIKILLTKSQSTIKVNVEI